MRTLFVSTHYPHKMIPQAGHFIAHQKLQEYLSLGRVRLAVIANSWEESFGIVPPEGSLITYLSMQQRALNTFGSPFLPLRVANRYSNKFHERIKLECQKFRPDQIHYEFTSAAAYIVPGIKSIWKEQDVTFESLMRRSKVEKNLFKKAFYRIESARMKTWEIRRALQMDKIITVTDRDRLNLISNGVSSSKIVVESPKGTAYVDPNTSPSKYNILFFGALNRFENQVSLDWFLREVFPMVLNANAHYTVHVVGGGLSDYDVSGAGENVVFHGFVSDPSSIFSSCLVAVAPVISGAGIKVKVLDYLESGLHVVATSIGAEGIESERLTICDDPSGFAAAILSCAELHP